jgi:hypothetical protein
MIKLDELTDEWANDCNIDNTNIKLEILNIPKLHAKYIRHLNDHKKASFKVKIDYDKMKEIRSSYYLGYLDKETLDEYGWDQFDLNIKTKGGIEKFINGDEILVKLLQKKTYHDLVISTCESILKELSSRTWQLKTYIDYEKFLSGS